MAKVKYDVSNAEVRNFEVPKPGVYEAVIQDMEHGESSSGNAMFTIVFEIVKGEYKGSRVWYYILTDGSQEWRLREFTEAMGLKPKGTLDTEALKGTVVQIKTAIDPARDGYDEKAKIKNVLPATGRNGSGADSEDEEEAPYDEWTLDDLKEEAEARELEIPGKKTKKKLVDALTADDEESGEGEDEEEEEGDEEEEEGDDESLTRADLEEMDRKALKALIADEELEIKVLKKHTDDDLRTKIAEALELGEDEEEEEGDEEEEEGDEDTNYEEWEISELKTELKERGIKATGRKSALVKALKEDDASDEEPF